MAKATAYRKMKNWDQADRVYSDIIAEVESKQNGYDQKLREERVYYEKAKANVFGGKPENAIPAFNYVIASSKSTPDEKADSHVWLGRIFDSRDDRNKAIEQYKAVLTLDCDAEYKSAAQAYLRTPFKG
jgi:tetratricopeptide (TPR) repeat protein